MSNRLLKQEEIDALLSQSVGTGEKAGEETASIEGQAQAEEAVLKDAGASETDRQPDDGGHEEIITAQDQGAVQKEETESFESLLNNEEKDALGEIGNICMGSAATTLSMLLNQKVSITSPRVTITTMDKLFRSFAVPHMCIYVRFIEGLSGYNLLIMQLPDAAVLADLMMGGDGKNISGELSEIGVSAASEAMNQMIGTASTSMAAMFTRTVNISPPETRVYHTTDDLTPPLDYKGPIVVVWFKMTVGSILDTQFMQVMGIDTAREEASLILGQLLPAGKESKEDDLGVDVKPAGVPDSDDKSDEMLIDEAPEPTTGSTVEAIGVTGSPAPARPSFSGAGTPVDLPLAEGTAGIDQHRLNRILDIPLKLTVLLGRTKWPIRDLLGITPGSIVELQNFVDEPVEVLVNGTPVAMGEVVVVNENFGIRITSIMEPEERLKNLRR